ncbi:MAG: monovalent cation/H+ antiporter subunit D family protein [Gemmatimonadales bacterium]|nr:monovalent cation/H+ antiporter subunit D family protein [Candidatus Palauibacter irciniicola]MYC18531.1 monovalent cation/H+ antiporter subunit D family protein [Gemmatimonadales bacterium]
MVGDQLPVLQVIVPLLAAPLCIILRRRSLVLPFAIIVCWAAFGVSVALLREVLEVGAITYELGGWAAPWGIEYRVDALGAFVLLFVSGIGALVLTYAPRSLIDEVPAGRHYLFCTLYLLSLTGLLGIAITGDLFNVFVFLEIAALSSYALIALGGRRQALPAAFQYLVMGTIGATFILIGIGLMYQMTGTLNMVDMADRLPAVEGMRTALVAFGFLTVGIALKMALFPLHVWLPNAYAYAPSAVSAFIAATSTKVSVYILLRFMFSVFGLEFSFEHLGLGRALMPLALAGIFVASTVAIFQRNIKRMLAYSSVAQVGYMVLGISFATATGLTGGIVHLFNHALIKGGLFMAMGCIMLRLHSVDLDEMAGIGRAMPWTMAAWALGGLGLIGVPATAGFISKWYLIQAALEQGSVLVAVLLLLSSLLALVYVWRVVETAFFREPSERAREAREAPLSMLVPTWVLLGATVFFGIYTAYSAGVAEQAAEAVLRGLP